MKAPTERERRTAITIQIGQDENGTWYWQREDQLGRHREGEYESFMAAFDWATIKARWAYEKHGVGGLYGPPDPG